MTVDENMFSNGAVGVAFLDPEKSGTVHLTVNPENGAIVMAEAHTIRLRGSGVDTAILDELGNTATALIAEYISNYLKNSAGKADNVDASDPAFRNLLGQTVSGLDQMLVDTVTHGQDEMVAYKMEAANNVKAPAKNSLISRITNSLEAVVYYDGGIHISHRGESQQYLVGARVQKLTQDHIAGGLFSKIGDLGDFIPQIQTNTVPMKKNEQLVFFSREAALSSFPLNQLKHWMGEGDPREQAQRIAEALREFGKTHGCVVVFSPGWQGTRQNDNIMSNGMFSLVNLANLDNDESGTISMMPENNHKEQTQGPLSEGAMDSILPHRPSSARLRPKKRNSSPKLKSRTSMAADSFASIAPADPFEPRRSHRRSIIESEMQSIVQKVMDQLPDQMDELESRIRTDIQKRLAGTRGDVLALATGEISKTMEKWVSEELPKIEERIHAELQVELTDMEMRIGKLMGKGLSGLRAEINDLKLEAEKWKSAMVNKATAMVGNDTDEVDVNELQQLNPEEIDEMFSTIPGAIAGTSARTNKPNRPPSQTKIGTPPVIKLQPATGTLPAPAVYQTPDTQDEEATLTTTHENIGALAAQQSRQVETDADIGSHAVFNGDDEIQQIDLSKLQESVVDEDIPEESNISFYPIGSTGSRKLIAGVIVGVVLLLCSTVAILLSPWSPISKDSLPVLNRLPTWGDSAAASPKQDKEIKRTGNTNAEVTPPLSADSTLTKASADQSDVTTAAVSSVNPQESTSMESAVIAKPSAPEEAENAPVAKPSESISLYNIEPIAEMNIEQLYDNGMDLYQKGDSGRDGKTKLTREQQYDVLKSSLAHFNEIIRRSGRIPPNTWFVKGRTEYNLTKIEKSKKLRHQYASDALASYERFLQMKDNVSSAKAKTIKRNQKTLMQMTRN
ncbi:MAG: hypothetical protein JXX14_25860 [Deltaproteobacteria bacterium]|nr:hypothetical protein [Deltaproteobacteria bacterium]